MQIKNLCAKITQWRFDMIKKTLMMGALLTLATQASAAVNAVNADWYLGQGAFSGNGPGRMVYNPTGPSYPVGYSSGGRSVMGLSAMADPAATLGQRPFSMQDQVSMDKSGLGLAQRPQANISDTIVTLTSLIDNLTKLVSNIQIRVQLGAPTSAIGSVPFVGGALASAAAMPGMSPPFAGSTFTAPPVTDILPPPPAAGGSVKAGATFLVNEVLTPQQFEQLGLGARLPVIVAGKQWGKVQMTQSGPVREVVQFDGNVYHHTAVLG